MAEETDVIWLTQEAFDKLQEEYDYLTTTGREEVSAKIAAARSEGDLSENGGYHAAREEQGQQEARIVVLKHMLDTAKVGEAPKNSDEVAPGLQITVAYDGDDADTETFLLGSREVMQLDDSVEINVFSPQSPMGAAIVGHRVGEEVTYAAPNGKPIKVKILKVEQRS